MIAEQRTVRSTKEAAAVAQLLRDNVQPGGTYTDDYLAGLVSHPQRGAVRAVFAEGDLIGAGYIIRLGPDTHDEIVCFDWPSPNDMDPGGFALIDGLAVVEEHRGKGFGIGIVQWLMRWAASRDCHTVVAQAWESGEDRRRSRPLLEKLGWQPHQTVENAFLGTPCHKCGAVCKCSATLMVTGVG